MLENLTSEAQRKNRADFVHAALSDRHDKCLAAKKDYIKRLEMQELKHVNALRDYIVSGQMADKDDAMNAAGSLISVRTELVRCRKELAELEESLDYTIK